MSESLFGDLDVAGAEELSSGVPDGPRNAILTGVEVQFGKKDPNARFLVFSYTPEGYNFSVNEWKGIPSGRPETWDNTIRDGKGRTQYDRNQLALSFLKARLVSLGVPEDRINSVQPSDLIGTPCIVTFKKDANGYSQVTKVALPGDSGVSLPQATPVSPTRVPLANVASVPAPVATAATVSQENPFAKR